MVVQVRKTLRNVCAVLLGALVVVACGTDDVEYAYPTPIGNDRFDASGKPTETIFGEDGFLLFGDDEAGGGGGGGGGIGVNSFLWRASLDTISFMPLQSADPFGGVIITDWYAPPETPQERFKINIFILGRQLRADGIRASVFRQTQAATDWTDSSVDEKTITDLENAILTRARQLRIASAAQ